MADHTHQWHDFSRQDLNSVKYSSYFQMIVLFTFHYQLLASSAITMILTGTYNKIQVLDETNLSEQIPHPPLDVN